MVHSRGWYLSEELRFANDNRYKIFIHKGYGFKKVENVFKGYIHYLYTIKSNTSDTVEKQIIKSLLNNLLGRFGLDINNYVSSIVTNGHFRGFIQAYKFRMRFIEDMVLLSYEKYISKEICIDNSLDFKKVLNKQFLDNLNKDNSYNFHDVSVVISSAVTSYSHVFMSKVILW